MDAKLEKRLEKSMDLLWECKEDLETSLVELQQMVAIAEEGVVKEPRHHLWASIHRVTSAMLSAESAAEDVTAVLEWGDMVGLTSEQKDRRKRKDKVAK